VLEAGAEDRRGSAVVLGGSEDDDGVDRPAVVALALAPDPEGGVAREEDQAGQAGGEEGEDIPAA